MALILRDIRLSIGFDDEECKTAAARLLGIPPSAVLSARLARQSLDARKKNDIHYNCSLRVTLQTDADEANVLTHVNPAVSRELPREDRLISHGRSPLRHQPVVVGAGPCGMFAALLLAREGYRPLVLERGKPVHQRVADVERFWDKAELDPNSNVLFGEGGAGTFSDGKLTTRIKDPRSDDVLRILIEMGAPAEIGILSKPHIGTDKLRGVVESIRNEIERLGGTIRFGARFCGFAQNDGALSGVIVQGADCDREIIPVEVCVLAIGHSARDTYQMLFDSGFSLSPKPFAVGVRIEHPQTVVNTAQYGTNPDPRLGAADYQLTAKVGDRGVYTFCMCPGGIVVASSSEAGGIVTNGMSLYSRDGKNANSALIVSVSSDDFGKHPLDGMRFQRSMEQTAYAAGGGGFVAPAQRVCDFTARRKSTRFDSVSPSYRPGVVGTDLHKVLPDFVANGILTALPQMGRPFKGFDGGDAVLTGVETRSSAPLRIERDERLQAPTTSGVYPAGEGAGYAGGIVSAAVDGLRVAETIVRAHGEPKWGK